MENPASARSAGPPSARSALSAAAFTDTDKLYDNDPETAKHAPTPFTEGDQPMAMESEVFDKDGAVRVQQRHAQKQESDGCWSRFKGGMRSIWSTKHTEDTSYDREKYIRTTLRELIIYIIFLIVLCILTFGMTSSTMYYYTKVMSELFLDSVGDNGFEKTFKGITRMEDFWKFAGTDGPLLKGLYWEKWYNNMNISEDQAGFIFYENKLLGLPRLRMLKVKGDSCKVPEAFEREIKQCYDTYSTRNEDKNPFGLQNGTAWVYRDAKDVGAASYWGLISTYGGGGFYLDLAPTKDLAGAQIEELMSGRWIDRGTRVLFIDFSVYNANINLFCIVKLILEFPATGGVIPSHSFRTVKLIRYVTAFDYFVLACEGIFCAFIIYYIIEEIIEIFKHRLSYFSSFWNVLDLVVIMLALACIGFSIFRTIVVDDKLDELLADKAKYANFESLSFVQTRFNDCVAVMIFFAWIKIFKYISFNKTMNQLSSTLSRCAKDVGGFAIMFFIFFFAYAQLGYLIFGTQVKDFSTFYDAVFTLLRTILGDFDFHELEQANRILGPIFFITYVFFVFFVLLNMFLAIINDTYAEVKAELATQKSEFEIADFFKKGYYNVMRKMNLKKDKLIDIQAALHGADANADKQVDFDEWRNHLKMRGYADQEIESMFAKYDLDGDRILDENEQRQMEADLEGQQDALDVERENLRAGNVNEDGPPSARSRFVDFDEGLDGTAVGPGFGGRVGRGLVSVEEFTVLNRRVDRMENSIGSVVTKIDAVLNKLEGMERVKMRHREKMAQLIESCLEGKGSDQDKLKEMSGGVKSELDRFEHDSETNP